MSATKATTDQWQQRLRGEGEDRDQAIGELRDILVRGLRISLANLYCGGLQAEDVAQEALLKILDSLDSFEGKSRFTTWVMSIATRIGISELRRKHYQDVSLEAVTDGESSSFEMVVDESETAEQNFQRQRLTGTLQQLIASELTQKQRVAIQALLGGIPIEVIAKRTGSNRNAVYKLIHDARVRLKAGLEDAGVELTDILSLFD